MDMTISGKPTSRVLVNQTTAASILNSFYVHVKENHGDSYASHAKRVTGFIIKALDGYGKSDGYSCIGDLISMKVVEAACSEMYQSGSFRRRVWLARKFITYIYLASGSDIGELKFDPYYCGLLNTISFWNKSGLTLASKPIMIGPDDHPLILPFLEYLKEKNQRPQKSHRIQIMVFLRWLIENIPLFASVAVKDIDLNLVNSSHIEEFKKHIESRVMNEEITYDTGSHHLHTIRRWFKILLMRKAVYCNPAHDLQINWVRKLKNPPLPGLDKIDAFFQAIIDESRTPLMDLALFSLYLTTGLRSISALQNCTIGSFDAQKKILHTVLKRGKKHEQELPDIVVEMISRYLQTRPGAKMTEPLWIGNHGEQLGYNGLREKFEKYQRIAGIPDNVGAAHILRHLYYSTMIGEGNDPEVVRTSTGARTINEMGPYIRVNESQLFKRFKERYPKYKRS